MARNCCCNSLYDLTVQPPLPSIYANLDLATGEILYQHLGSTLGLAVAMGEGETRVITELQIKTYLSREQQLALEEPFPNYSFATWDGAGNTVIERFDIDSDFEFLSVLPVGTKGSYSNTGIDNLKLIDSAATQTDLLFDLSELNGYYGWRVNGESFSVLSGGDFGDIGMITVLPDGSLKQGAIRTEGVFVPGGDANPDQIKRRWNVFEQSQVQWQASGQLSFVTAFNAGFAEFTVPDGGTDFSAEPDWFVAIDEITPYIGKCYVSGQAPEYVAVISTNDVPTDDTPTVYAVSFDADGVNWIVPLIDGAWPLRCTVGPGGTAVVSVQKSFESVDSWLLDTSTGDIIARLPAGAPVYSNGYLFVNVGPDLHRYNPLTGEFLWETLNASASSLDVVGNIVGIGYSSKIIGYPFGTEF